MATSMTPSVNATVIARAAAALYGVQLGNASMTWALDAVDQLTYGGSVAALIQDLFSRDFAGMTYAQVASVITTNVGITSGKADVDAYLAQVMTDAGRGNEGATIVAIVNAFSALQTHPLPGLADAAAAFRTQISAATKYAQTSGTTDQPLVTTESIVARTFVITPGTALGADVMRITGGQDVRIDFTNVANQVTGLDLDGDGTIEIDGRENVSSNFPAADRAANFEIVDAYSRNPLNHKDSVNNFLGDIQFDGNSFRGDGVRTNGNVFLGGLGTDTAFGGVGNDFLAGGGIAQGRTGQDKLYGGRNADFFFAEFAPIDQTDGAALMIDGGNTADNVSAGVGQSSQDSDWLLLEASDDDEPVQIWLNDDNGGPAEPGDGIADNMGRVLTRAGKSMVIDDIENIDASGNLYGFLNGIDVQIGARAVDDRDASAASVGRNYGYGTSAQLRVEGSEVANVIIGGYDNDYIDGNGGADILFGGNMAHLFDPNLAGIVNDGRDELYGDGGNDSIVFEADTGIIDGGADTDTLFLTNLSLGTQTATDMTSDGVLRFDLLSQTLADAAGYGGANVNGTQDQTNYKSGITGGRVTVTNMESVVATGLGTIDYRAAGTNSPELGFTNQQNQLGFQGNLDLRGTAGANTLYATNGTDIIEGRGGNDNLSGGDANDDFYFGTTNAGANIGDNVDVIHRQTDANNDNLWDTSATGANLFERDFNIGGASTTGASSLVVDLGTTNLASPDVALTSFSIRIAGVTFAVADGAALIAANSAAEVAALVNTAYRALDARVTAVAVGNTIVVTDTGGRDISDTVAEGYAVGGVVSNGAFSAQATFNAAGTTTTKDRLIYKAYEDRADNEGVDDNAILGSAISLGTDAYAEDLVIWFGDEDADGLPSTRIAEDQAYDIVLTNLTTQDRVVVSVNGVNYALQVGVDLDGNIIAAEDGVDGDTQTSIQNAFVDRLVTFINSFMDDDTTAGRVTAAKTAGDGTTTSHTIQLTQATYNGEQTVFMNLPTVTLTNLSGGEAPTRTVTNVSQHEVELLDFDGRNGELNNTNVLFVGQEFEDNGRTDAFSRATLATAKNAGETIVGKDALVVDVGPNNLQDVVFGTTTAIPNNTATNTPLSTVANGVAVHGDDFLLGGAGVDTISGGTGDDRVEGSIGGNGTTTWDTLDGGKNYYAVQVLGEPQARVYILNKWEAANPTKVTALTGLTITSITLINQSEDGITTVAGSGVFDDTLQFTQRNFTAGTTRFTVALSDFALAGGVVELRNDGAGTVGVDVDGNGTIDNWTRFTNFENIRTVSGTGNAVADDGQGNDTLDVTALSAVTTGAGGIHYNLTNGTVGASAPGDVRYSTNAILGASPDPVFPETNDYESLIIKVDGVENVIASTGADMLLIDETEAAKNNTFTAGLGVDRIEYLNNFGTVVAEPTVTIKVDNVAASLGGTDTVTMTGGRVGSTVAVDTLGGVEFIQLSQNTAAGTREDDLLDVTSLVGGSVVSYVDGTVKDLGGTTHVTIQGIDEIENIWAAGGNDTVLVADVSAMGLNARSDAGTAAGTSDADITFMTFVDFDTIGTTNARTPFLQQTTAQIEDVINLFQFKFDLSKNSTGADSDTVDYSAAQDNISVVVELDATKPNQFVLVDGDGASFYDAVGDLEEAGDRIDQLIGIERIVAAQGDSVLDLSGSTKGLEIKFSAFDVANRVASLDRDVYSVRISDLTTASPLQRTFIEYRDAGQLDTGATAVTQPKAVWSRIEGSDNAEVVILNSAHSADTNTFNLRGGANQVKYNELTKSIQLTLQVVDFVATDADGADNIFGNADDTGLIKGEVKFFDGNGNAAGNITAGPGGTHNISSYTANNGVSTGSLRIAASQDAEDTLAFQGLSEKVFLLSEAGTVDNQITVRLGSGAAQNSVVLTGFEFVQDSASNDVYDFGSLTNAAIGLDFLDNGTADHDTIRVDATAIGFGNGLALAAGYAGPFVVDAATIHFGAIRGSTALSAAGFDFDVLDISKIDSAALTTIVGAASGGAEVNSDELIFGKIGSVTSATLFESIVLTQATITENGTTVVLNTTANSLTAGTKTVTLSDNNATGNHISFGGAVMESPAVAGVTQLRADAGNNVTSGVTFTMVGTEAVNVTGGNGNDTITTNGGNDTIRGGQGNDTLNGGFTAAVGEVATVTLGGGAAVLSAAEVLTLTGAGGNTLILGGSGAGTAEIKTATATADADQIGALLMAQTNTFLETELGYAAGSILSKSYSGDSNVFTITFTSAAGDVTNLAAAVSAGTMTAVAGNTAPTAAVESSDTYVFESTAALNGNDTINNFNAANAGTDDLLDFTAFLGAAATAPAAANFVTAGLSLLGAANVGVVFNKGTLAAGDIQTTAAAGKIAVEDNSKAVVLVTADDNGTSDGTNNAYLVYYVQDTDTGAGQTWQVTLVATLNSATELNAADFITGTDSFV